MVVVDTNVLAYLFIEGEHTPLARRAWSRDPHWRAPPLWRAEFLNVLVISQRTGVLTDIQAVSAWRAASAVMTGSESEPGGTDVLESAVRLGLTAYDAQFVVVAQRLGVPLVTADRGILAAAPEMAVSLRAFASA